MTNEPDETENLDLKGIICVPSGMYQYILGWDNGGYAYGYKIDAEGKRMRGWHRRPEYDMLEEIKEIK